MHHSVTFVNQKTHERLTVEVAEGELLWKSAVKSGMKLSASCQVGACLACAGKIVTGTVEHQKKVTLSPQEVEAGFILTCCAIPTSDCTILVEQEEALLAETEMPVSLI